MFLVNLDYRIVIAFVGKVIIAFNQEKTAPIECNFHSLEGWLLLKLTLHKDIYENTDRKDILLGVTREVEKI